MKEAIVKPGFLLLLSIAVYGCGPAGKPPRKKLPDMLDSGYLAPEQMSQPGTLKCFPSDSMATTLSAMSWINMVGPASRKKLSEPTDEWSQLCPQANSVQASRLAADGPSTCNIGEVSIAGKSYYSVQMANAAHDDAVLDIVKLYSSFAGNIVGMLLNEGRDGALIDLGSQNGNSAERAEFLAKNKEGQVFSVIFTWDRSSSGRASLFMNELQQLPGITTTRIDNNKHF